jgi:hypothetical protein
MMYIRNQVTKTKRAFKKMSKNLKKIKLVQRTKSERLAELTDEELSRIGELALGQ